MIPGERDHSVFSRSMRAIRAMRKLEALIESEREFWAKRSHQRLGGLACDVDEAAASSRKTTPRGGGVQVDRRALASDVQLKLHEDVCSAATLLVGQPSGRTKRDRRGRFQQRLSRPQDQPHDRKRVA